mgnify:CR=1 FL=1
MTAPEPVGSEWAGVLSEGGDAPATAVAHARAPGEPRYRLGGELGAGAMGRVRVAFDTLLGREIALKQVRVEGDGAAEVALLREARVTAGLDHPAIIAVLDAGHDDDGQPFYAMRVVHGESLAERVAAFAGARADALDRHALLRALLQATQAMAYAHARGVVHRDLSPRNVRLGAHGEVVVMDWGLAVTLDEAARGGVVCGTPGYRAPELAQGAPAGPTCDVWSLGALVHLVLTGAPPGSGAMPRGIPAPLRSIVARALAPSPADRYADAADLAADLARYLDGGRVLAHRDRLRDRAARVIRRHPGALAVGVLGLTAVALVAIVLGTQASRRAGEARRSRAEARDALRTMVVASAGAAVVADRRVDATALAAQARELGDDAAAAGVLAAFAAAPPVVERFLGAEASCRTLDVRGDGARLCVAEQLLWWKAGGEQRRLELGGLPPTAARFLADGGAIVVSAGPSGNVVFRVDARRAVVGRHDTTGGAPSIDEAAGWAIVGAAEFYLAVSPDGAARSVRPCPPGLRILIVAAHPASTPAAPATATLCSDHSIVLDGPAGPRRQRWPELDARVPGALAGYVDGDHFVIGGVDGRVAMVALADGRVLHAGSSPVGPVTRMTAGPGGDAIVVGDDGVGLWRPLHGSWRHVVGRERAVDASLAGARVVAYGAGELHAWDLVAGAGVHRVATLGGLGAVAWSPDGALVAFGGGDGVVHVLELASGRLRRVAVASQVVKSLAFSADGRTLVAGVAADAGVRVIELAHLTVRGTVPDASWRVRRLAFLTPDTLLAIGWHSTPFTFPLAGGEARPLPERAAMLVDLVAAREIGAPVLALDTEGGIHRFRAPPGSEPVLDALRPAPGAVVIAGSGDGRVAAFVDAHAAQIELRDVERDVTLGRLAAPAGELEDAALDHDGARLALARVDGTVEVWDTRTRRRTLVLRAHDGRAAAVAFSPDGCTLATAGWDASARLLALCAGPAQPGALQ